MATVPSQSSVADTIESPQRPPRAAAQAPVGTAAPRQMALIEGSAPQLSQETLNLLRDRLKMMAVLLAVCFAAFLVRSLWSLGEYVNGPHAVVFYAHVAVTALMVLMAQRLCVNCNLVLNHLRVSELLIVGGPAVFFVLLNYHKLLFAAGLEGGHAYVPVVSAGWVILIFVYALFVPNTWQRAAVVLSILGIAPLAVTAAAYFRSSEFAALLKDAAFSGTVSEQVLVMLFAVIAATIGVGSIGLLRKEAFVARQLGQYRLKRLLGSGGMGEVYLAEHQMMKRPCAIKVIRPEKAGDPRVLARFEREVQATAKLSHWNSIDIYDYGRTADGTFYYVMEFLPGHNLGELVETHGPLPVERTRHLMLQICDALAEAHGEGLIHRDIKPANIYCAYRGGLFDVAKLLDFGLAKPAATPDDAALTQEGAITGSPLFMSPEQATGSDQLDQRSDIYSLGAVMYFMVTGRPPFEYDRPMKVMVAHAAEQPVAPSELVPTIPIELEEVILRCLEKEPDDRFQDAVALADAIREVPTASSWTNATAANWWKHYGCPERKRLAEEAAEMAAC